MTQRLKNWHQLQWCNRGVSRVLCYLPQKTFISPRPNTIWVKNAFVSECCRLNKWFLYNLRHFWRSCELCMSITNLHVGLKWSEAGEESVSHVCYVSTPECKIDNNFANTNDITLKSVSHCTSFYLCACVPIWLCLCERGTWWQGYLEKEMRGTSSSWTRHKAAGSGVREGQDSG